MMHVVDEMVSCHHGVLPSLKKIILEANEPDICTDVMILTKCSYLTSATHNGHMA